MKRALKWTLMAAAALVALLLCAAVLIPFFFDLEDFRPQIETRLTRSAGRPVDLGGEISLSLLPRAQLQVGGLTIRNPDGFETDAFLTVGAFAADVALLPLLSGEIQIRRIRLASPRLSLERKKDGTANWEGLGPREGPASRPTKTPPEEPSGGPAVPSLQVAEFSVEDGSIQWIDHRSETRGRIQGIEVRLSDISLDRKIRVSASAASDGMPVSITGAVGPVGSPPGREPIPVNLVVRALETAEVRLDGRLEASPGVSVSVEIPPFSLREAIARSPFSLETADPEALGSVSLACRLAADPSGLKISEGTAEIDDTRARYSVEVRNPAHPEIRFDLRVERLDLDRYLPPAAAEASGPPPEEGSEAAPVDYAPLRRLILSGEAEITALKAAGVRMDRIAAKVSGEDGRFRADPVEVDLYSGRATMTGSADVREPEPESRFTLGLEGIKSGALAADLWGKEFIEGITRGEINGKCRGDRARRIRETLNGDGRITVEDGAIVGVDLGAMIRDVKNLLGASKAEWQTGRTPFAELRLAWTVKDGLVALTRGDLTSPVLGVDAGGTADLPSETLDLRVESKLNEALSGGGEPFMVPFTIGGTFDDPKIRTDPAALIRQAEKVPDLIKGAKKGMGELLKEKGKLLDRFLDN